MAELDLQELVDQLMGLFGDEEPVDFSPLVFELTAIVGHRTDQANSEYKVRWKPSRLKKLHLLTGTIYDEPLRRDVEKVFQEPDNPDRVRVAWKDTWVVAENVTNCGELLHEFWTRVYWNGRGTKASIVDGMLVRHSDD